jgi:ankyrin repeat protein
MTTSRAKSRRTSRCSKTITDVGDCHRKSRIARRSDLTARDEALHSTPLAWAAKYGQLEMVKFLLRRAAPKSLPDDPSWATPLAWAVRRGHDEIAKLLS